MPISGLPTRASSPICPKETIRSRLIKESDSFRTRAHELEILIILNWPEVVLSETQRAPVGLACVLPANVAVTMRSGAASMELDSLGGGWQVALTLDKNRSQTT